MQLCRHAVRLSNFYQLLDFVHLIHLILRIAFYRLCHRPCLDFVHFIPVLISGPILDLDKVEPVLEKSLMDPIIQEKANNWFCLKLFNNFTNPFVNPFGLKIQPQALSNFITQVYPSKCFNKLQFL